MDVNETLDDLDRAVRLTIATVPTVEVHDELDPAAIPSAGSDTWWKVPDVVVVSFDLRNSTQLGTSRRRDTSTARIYRAAIDGAVQSLHGFDAGFIDIQGDGGFGLFWGERKVERAMCAAITIATFSRRLVERLNRKWDDLPATGFKVGVARGRTLVKNLGTPRKPAEQEPVWAGKPVNYATKCAQTAESQQIVVAGSVWDAIADNDLLVYTCNCAGGRSYFWEDHLIDKLPDGDEEQFGRRTRLAKPLEWCPECGTATCNEILAGVTRRDISDYMRASVEARAMQGQAARIARTRRSQQRTLRMLDALLEGYTDDLPPTARS